MIIYIDIDETICNTPDDRDYAKAEPILENIEKANKLYDEGNTVIYWTARGRNTGINWEQVTKRQFEDWGVKNHGLKFGKPYDMIIDDKALNTRDW